MSGETAHFLLLARGDKIITYNICLQCLQLLRSRVLSSIPGLQILLLVFSIHLSTDGWVSKSICNTWGGMGPVRPVWGSLHTGFYLRNSPNAAESQEQNHHSSSPGYPAPNQLLPYQIIEFFSVISKCFLQLHVYLGEKKRKKHKDLYSSRKPKTCIKFLSNQPTQLHTTAVCKNQKSRKATPQMGKIQFSFQICKFLLFPQLLNTPTE